MLTVIIAYIASTLVSIAAVYFWRRYSTEFVDSFIVAISSWLTALSIINMFIAL